MPISTILWRAQIGTFGIMIAKLCVMNTWSSITKAKFQNSFVLSFFFLITFLSLLLILSNDIELNPGPKKDSSKRNFSLAHWNLNSIAAQNFVKLSRLEAYYTLHSYDPMTCLWRVTIYIVLTILTILKKEGFWLTATTTAKISIGILEIL